MVQRVSSVLVGFEHTIPNTHGPLLHTRFEEKDCIKVHFLEIPPLPNGVSHFANVLRPVRFSHLKGPRIVASLSGSATFIVLGVSKEFQVIVNVTSCRIDDTFCIG